MSKKRLIIACIPAFSEEKTIARVVLLAQRFVDRVVVCDDGGNLKELLKEVTPHRKKHRNGTSSRLEPF